MDNVLMLMLGAALTWAFYFVQRRVERRRTHEAITRNTQLLALRQGMAAAQVSLEELAQFERRLIGQAESAVRNADRLVARAEVVSRDDSPAARDRAALGRDAHATLARTDARMAAQVQAMRVQLDGEALDAFDAAHAAWLEYRERYARFIAAGYAGASLAPLMRAVTLDSVTAMWITELETQLGVVDAADEHHEADDDDEAGQAPDADAPQADDARGR